MKENDITLQQLSDKIDSLQQIAIINAKRVLNLDEAALFTGYSRGHLYRLTSQRLIPHFKHDNRLFFDKHELEAWLTDTPVRTAAEIQRTATKYVTNNPTRL
ncbi:MAG: helix-turn-helix domain-containing protein [Bacteroidaceae bacterium]|nr:helix-turn-helix domain-containing protein [Bacteroidaceae bacterium]